MSCTKKWTHVGPEARRLAELGLSPLAIAEQLGVHRSTVQRWMAAGRIGDTRASGTGAIPAPLVSAVPAREWATAMRAAFLLDATQAQLVTLADYALGMAESPAELPAIRLAAAGRFQSLVKQLASHLRPVVDESPAPMAPAPTARIDPRALLMPTVQ